MRQVGAAVADVAALRGRGSGRRRRSPARARRRPPSRARSRRGARSGPRPTSPARPASRESTGRIASSTNSCTLRPKPPPTAGHDHPHARVGQAELRREHAAHEERHLRRRPHGDEPSAASQSAITPRPSSGAACVRPKWKRLRKTCAAPANASSTSPASNSMCAKLLSPSSSCRTRRARRERAPRRRRPPAAARTRRRSARTRPRRRARERATTAATASPTKRTRSSGSSAACRSWPRAAWRSSSMNGGRSRRSSPLTTSGDAVERARPRGIDRDDARVRVRAAQNATCSVPGRLDVVEVAPRPARKRGSSTRITRGARRSGRSSRAPPAAPARRACTASTMPDVARAAADVAGEVLADLVLARIGRPRRAAPCAASSMPGVQKPHCRPWLRRNACWIGCSAVLVREALDGQRSRRPRPAPRARGRRARAPVDEHRAGAAAAVLAADVRAGEAELVAQEVGEQRARLGEADALAAVDAQAHGPPLSHVRPPRPSSARSVATRAASRR